MTTYRIKTPSVRYRTPVRYTSEQSSNRTVYPTSSPTRLPISAATRVASAIAGSRLGCVTPILGPLDGAEEEEEEEEDVNEARERGCRRRSWGSWVDLPHPVSPRICHMSLLPPPACIETLCCDGTGTSKTYDRSIIRQDLLQNRSSPLVKRQLLPSFKQPLRLYSQPLILFRLSFPLGWSIARRARPHLLILLLYHAILLCPLDSVGLEQLLIAAPFPYTILLV